jgi:hypothetical protein
VCFGGIVAAAGALTRRRYRVATLSQLRERVLCGSVRERAP